MSMLRDKRVLLGVSGGIAAYKAAELVRALDKAGAEVRVVMTRGAREFVTPLTFEVLSGRPVGTELFEPGAESDIGHIELARWPDVVVIAPATANLIARARCGMADDLLTTLLLATTAPLLFCPSMNTRMLEHPAVRENIGVLAARHRTHVLDPDHGELACKEVGTGRLPDAEVILASLESLVTGGRLAGRRVVVTAGPTREHFDPVRFLSNPSSGKMGYALAAAARGAGADIVLVTGPTSLPDPLGCEIVRVTTAAEMAAAIHATPGDVLLMAAAVADWTPAEVAPQKRKKGAGPWSPSLQRTEDVLASVSASPNRPSLVVGFAAETEDIEANAREKLARKNLDAIVANDVSGADGAFGNDTNRVLLIPREGDAVAIGPTSKRDVADAIVAWVAERLGDDD